VLILGITSNQDISLSPLAAPAPFLFFLFLGLLVVLDYRSPRITDGFRNVLIIGIVPMVAIFCLLYTTAELAILADLPFHGPRPRTPPRPGFSEFLGNYIILTFTGLILVRGLRAKSAPLLLIALVELALVILAIACEIAVLGSRD
jgi:hypothetical protein